jgi:DNA-directed RNA polymerase subunit E'/Rpb7
MMDVFVNRTAILRNFYYYRRRKEVQQTQTLKQTENNKSVQLRVTTTNVGKMKRKEHGKTLVN